MTWEKPFLATLAEQFGTGMRVVDYIHDPDGARQAINQWVSDQTHRKIPALIPAGALDATSRLTLVNALYFKAPWFTPFTAAARPAPFHRVDGTTVDTRMMELSATIAHARGPNWTAVRLPYAGQQAGHEPTVIVPGLRRLRHRPRPGRPGDCLDYQAPGGPAVHQHPRQQPGALPWFSLQTSKAPLADLMKVSSESPRRGWPATTSTR